MQQTFTDTIEVSPAFGKFLEDNRYNIQSVISGSLWENFSELSNEIMGLLAKYGFDGQVQVIAYLLSSQKFTINDKRYKIQLIKGNINSFVNMDKRDRSIVIDDDFGTDIFQTIFTQKEIDEIPNLKQFEKWKIEVD